MKSWQMGTHLIVLSDSYPMNTNMTGYKCFLKIFASLYMVSRISKKIFTPFSEGILGMVQLQWQAGTEWHCFRKQLVLFYKTIPIV